MDDLRGWQRITEFRIRALKGSPARPIVLRVVMTDATAA